MPVSIKYKNELGYIPCDKVGGSVSQGLEFAYNDFFARSYTDYGYEILPLEFSDIITLVPSGFLNVLGLFDGKILKAFLIYNIVIDVVEISIIHCVGGEDIIAKKEALIQGLKEEIKDKNCKIISYE
jgi:hypothetical protein